MTGQIVADMTFLKDQGLRPEFAPDTSTYRGTRRRFYTVTVDLMMKVDGRNLSFSLLHPSIATLNGAGDPRVQAEGQVCIAAAFQPGTK